MKRTMILATALSLAGSLGASSEPLRAVRAPAGAMPAFEAVTITRSMGLDPLGGPVWQNGSYVLLATDGDGREMRVVLDAHDGRVLAVRPMAHRYFAPVVLDDGPDDEVEADVIREPAYDAAPPPVTLQVDPVWRRAPVRQESHKRRATTKPQQSAKLPADAVPPLPTRKPEAAVQKPATPIPRTDQTAVVPSAAPTSASDSMPASASKPIRKIQIDRTPDAPASGTASETSVPSEPASADKDRSTFGFPINPLL